jgi:hypothetical protein
MTDLDPGADLRQRFDRALADADAPDGLTAAALTRGHRLRRRRRLVTAGAGLATAAAVTALVVPSLGGGGTSTDPGTASDPTSGTSASPSPSPGPSSGTPTPGPDGTDLPGALEDLQPEGWWDVPSADLVEVLEGLLPAEVSVAEAETRVETGDPDDPWAPGTGGLHGVLDGPTGPGAFQVILYPPDASTADGIARVRGAATLRSRTRCRAYHDSCEPLTSADGTRIGRVATDVENGTAYVDVALLGPDGGALYFYVADSTGEKPGYEAPTAEAPPLTTAQLRALAEAPEWTAYRP